MNQLTTGHKATLRRFAKTDEHNVKSPSTADIANVFDLASMGLMVEYFNGCINDNVAYITPEGLNAIKKH
jgi:hypothetical protein